jgi:hypothetical protein
MGDVTESRWKAWRQHGRYRQAFGQKLPDIIHGVIHLLGALAADPETVSASDAPIHQDFGLTG